MGVPSSVCDAKMEKVIKILNFKKKSYYSKNVGLCKESVWLKKKKRNTEKQISNRFWETSL